MRKKRTTKQQGARKKAKHTTKTPPSPSFRSVSIPKPYKRNGIDAATTEQKHFHETVCNETNAGPRNPVVPSSLVLRSDPRAIESTAASGSTGKTHTASTIDAGVSRPAAATSGAGGVGAGLTLASVLVAVVMVMVVVVVLVDYPNPSVHCARAGKHDRRWVEGVICYRRRRQERRSWWV